MIALLLLACQPTEVAPSTETGPIPTPILSLNTQVLDPTLDGAELRVEVSLAEPGDCDFELVLYRGDQLLAEGSGTPWTWDGRLPDGSPAPVGTLSLYVHAECDDGSRATSVQELAIVRLAPASVDIGARDPGQEQVLAFHKADLWTAGVQPIEGPEYLWAGLQIDPGAAILEPWTDPDIPPAEGESANLPAGLVAGAIPVADWVAASEAFGGPTQGEDVQIELLTPSTGPWTEGRAELDALPPTLGRGELEIEWSWAACLGQGCEPVAVPGSRTTRHPVYRLFGPSTLRVGEEEGQGDGTPWIGALADSAEVLEGLAADDAAATMDALRERVHLDPWLVYDPSDRSYSDYEGEYIYWSSIESNLSAWLDRRKGLSLYCHSVSCLLSVLGNHWGIPAEQIVLGVGFQTNLTRAAGTEDWLRWSFNSHSVATLDDHALVWDGSVDLDGDSDPANQPVKALSPASMPLEDYLRALSPDEIGIVNSGRCFYR